jgi:YVTN family beta-propeller protein
MKKIIFLSLCSIIFNNAFGQNYKITKKINIAGDEGWDYLSVDEVNQNLFVSHGSVVNVVDLKTDKTIATIQDTKGVHGIAIANDLNKAFISDGKDNAVSVVDLKTFELIGKIKIEGEKPDAILYDFFSHLVFTFNAKSNDATVVDAKTNKVVKTISLGGKPEFAVSNTKGLIYVNIEDKNEIKTIDTNKLEVINTWAISPGDEPSGLAIDITNNILFSVCGNKMMVILDALSGKILQTLPIDEGCDGVAFDAKRNLVFASNGVGNITVVKEESEKIFSVIETIKTLKGARTIALNKSNNQLYLSVSDYGEKPQESAENPNRRAKIMPNTFGVLVVGQ